MTGRSAVQQWEPGPTKSYTDPKMRDNCTAILSMLRWKASSSKINSKRHLEEYLITAIRCGDEKLTKYLLSELKLDPNFELDAKDPDCPKGSPLCLAIKLGRDHLIPDLLLAGATNFSGRRNFSALHCAAKRGAKDVVELLLNQFGVPDSEDSGTTPIHLAAQEGHDVVLDLLLSSGMDVDARDKQGRTPLFLAALNNHLGVTEALIHGGANLNALSNQNRSALHQAAQAGSLDVVQRLVREGLKPNAKDKEGFTSLDLAVINGRTTVANWMRKRNFDGQDEEALVATCRLRLENAGKHIIRFTESGKAEVIQSNLESELFDPYYMDEDGKTPLHLAVEWGKRKVVEVFLSCGVYPGVVDYEGNTPLTNACASLRSLLTSAIACQEEQATTRDQKSQLYYTLLEHIASSEDPKPVSQMLGRGAPMEPLGKIPSDALHVAISNNRTRIVSLLLAAGARLTGMHNEMSLLQVVWREKEISIQLRALITRAYQNQLKFERHRLQQCPEKSQEVALLLKGVGEILEVLGSSRPWLAKWKVPPSGGPSLLDLMSSAATHDCALTCFFLYQAGAFPFQGDSMGSSPLLTALKKGHLRLASMMAKDLKGSPYVRDLDFMRSVMAMGELEEDLFDQELRKLEMLRERKKDQRDKEQIDAILGIQERLFDSSRHPSPPLRIESSNSLDEERKVEALLLASQRGYGQLAFLLLTEGSLAVDVVVDITTGTTALHQAAAHGNIIIISLLLAHGADSLLPDRYGHTALHLAALFGHHAAYRCIDAACPRQVESRAGTTPCQIQENFKGYLQLHRKGQEESNRLKDGWGNTDSATAIRNLLKDVRIKDLADEAEEVFVRFDEGEAREVRDAIVKEVERISDYVSTQKELYEGDITLVGSSADGTRLYAPDEFDISLVLSNVTDFRFQVTKLSQKDAAACGHQLKLDVEAPDADFKDDRFLDHFHELVLSFLCAHEVSDKRLSIVPPSVRRTQVGSAISLAWQGTNYPLLLVDVDFVPVVAMPWHPLIDRPQLTPVEVQRVYLSSKSGGEWRLSFSEAEVAVLKGLDDEERLVYLTCKTLLSHMKAEPWMPWEVRSRHTWWHFRSWKIPLTTGFAFKNSFFKQVEAKRRSGTRWLREDLGRWMMQVFEGMCRVEDNETLTPTKVSAYFGGDFEMAKIGEGAPEIIQILREVS